MTNINKTTTARIHTTINNLNSYSGTWNIIYKTFKDAITDPTGNNAYINIYGQYPDIILKDDTSSTQITNSYPLVIVNPVMSPDSSNINIDANLKQMGVDIEIEIFATKLTDLDNIRQQQNKLLLENENYFKSVGLYNLELRDSNPNFFMRSGTRIHQRSFFLSFSINGSVN